MKYAVRYTRSFRHLKEVDEVIFIYNNQKNIALNITNLINENQRALIDVSYCSLEKIKSILQEIIDLKIVHPNMAVIFNFKDYQDLGGLFIDHEIPYFFSTFVKSYELAYAMVNAGATDLYIVEEMGFNLDKLQTFRERGVNLRVFPNIAQCAAGTSHLIPPITKFWIRPEDTEIYDEYIDVMEFMRDDNKLSVLYEIYKQKQWLGQVKDIISDFHIKLDNTSIAPHFGPSRINCRKKCMLGKCNLCLSVYSLAKVFDDNKIALIKKKDNNEFKINEENMLSK